MNMSASLPGAIDPRSLSRLKISALLRKDYSIGHTTLQFECRDCDRCDGSNLYCQLDPGESAQAHSHSHSHFH